MYGPSSAFQTFVAVTYPGWSLLWAALWIKVGFHYGRAAFHTWRLNGATWKTVCCDVFDPLMFAGRDFLARYRWARRLFGIKQYEYASGLIPTSSPGNILRFAIFVGSITPVSFGLGFAFVDMWRADVWKLIVILVFMVSSILSALGHLFLVHRSSQRHWANIVTATFVWFIFFGPLFGYLLRVAQGLV